MLWTLWVWESTVGGIGCVVHGMCHGDDSRPDLAVGLDGGCGRCGGGQCVCRASSSPDAGPDFSALLFSILLK